VALPNALRDEGFRKILNAENLVLTEVDGVVRSLIASLPTASDSLRQPQTVSLAWAISRGAQIDQAWRSLAF
jgi:hypothetical protein